MVIETILFDLDDTLVAEMEWARGGWHLVAEHLAAVAERDGADLERMMSGFFAHDRRRVFNQLADTLGLDSDALHECIAIYRHSPRPLTLLPDAAAALEFAADRRTGIVSDGDVVTQSTKVECAGLASSVEVIVYTGALGADHSKPSPSGFLEALRQLRTAPDTAIYVADNAAKDFIGPRGLGMRTIQVTRAGGVYAGVQAPAGGEPDAVVSSLLELASVVAAWEHELARGPAAGP
jgi:putative hydrolase of the HAD superfamily